MRKYLKPAYLPHATLVCGVIAMLFRLRLLALGEDDWGLLPAGIFPDVMSWVVVALAMALLAVGTWQLREANKYSYNFPASIVGATGIALAAFAFFVDSLVKLIAGAAAMEFASAILGLLASVAMGFWAYYRWKGIRPSVLFHGAVCVFMMLTLVSNYQNWSALPQLQDYGFELLAIVFLMLATYQRAAFDVNCGNRRAYAFFSLGALFFSIAAIPGCNNPGFFIGCAAWMLATPCQWTTLPKKEG